MNAASWRALGVDPAMFGPAFVALIEQLDAANAQVREANAAVDAAQEALAAARQQDDAAALAARCEGRDDPGELATRAAEGMLADAERDQRVARLARERVEGDVDAEIEAGRPDALLRIEGELDKVRRDALEHVQAIVTLLAHESRLRRASRLLDLKAVTRAGVGSEMLLRFPEQKARTVPILPLVEQLAEHVGVDRRTIDESPGMVSVGNWQKGR